MITKMEKRVYFYNNRKQKLVGILHTPEIKGRLPLVVACHGYKSSKDSRKYVRLGAEFTKQSIAFFRFDCSGCGESEGKFEDSTVTKYSDDLEAAIDYIYTLDFVDKNRIGLIGNRLGGAVSILVASKDKRIKTIVFISPATDYVKFHRQTDEYSPAGLKQWKKQGWTYTYYKKGERLKIKYDFYEDLTKYNYYTLAKKIKIPCLIIHGDQDKTVFLEGSKKLLKSLNKESVLQVIKGEDHLYDNPKNFKKMIKSTVQWFEKHLK